mmetsp:Transcript_4064/g.7005  ORF Transcript_4064/g.7005 Transcript_4064/m.7005 type:complete len:323 (-) Transcript_4064:447-1415(-)
MLLQLSRSRALAFRSWRHCHVVESRGSLPLICISSLPSTKQTRARIYWFHFGLGLICWLIRWLIRWLRLHECRQKCWRSLGRSQVVLLQLQELSDFDVELDPRRARSLGGCRKLGETHLGQDRFEYLLRLVPSWQSRQNFRGRLLREFSPRENTREGWFLQDSHRRAQGRVVSLLEQAVVALVDTLVHAVHLHGSRLLLHRDRLEAPVRLYFRGLLQDNALLSLLSRRPRHHNLQGLLPLPLVVGVERVLHDRVVRRGLLAPFPCDKKLPRYSIVPVLQVFHFPARATKRIPVGYHHEPQVELLAHIQKVVRLLPRPVRVPA